MYISKKYHFLSKAISSVAFLNMLLQIVNAIVRIICGDTSDGFDMQNSYVFYGQLISQIVLIAIIFIIFLKSMRDLKKVESSIQYNDAYDMAALQREYIPNSISTLSAVSIYQLLQIWTAIFVLIQSMSIITNYQYRSFVNQLTEAIPQNSYEDALTVASIYNSTHGFKYICMFTALILGIFITGIFLEDRFLKIVACILSGLFMLAFAVFEMVIFFTSFKVISIVWTAVIFHGVETIGLLMLSIYLSKHYQGL